MEAGSKTTKATNGQSLKRQTMVSEITPVSFSLHPVRNLSHRSLHGNFLYLQKDANSLEVEASAASLAAAAVAVVAGVAAPVPVGVEGAVAESRDSLAILPRAGFLADELRCSLHLREGGKNKETRDKADGERWTLAKSDSPFARSHDRPDANVAKRLRDLPEKEKVGSLDECMQ